MDIQNYMQDIGRGAQQAARLMATAPTAAKNTALQAIAHRIEQTAGILSA